MNLLYRGCASKENYQLSILEKLRSEGIFSKCTIISQTCDDGDKYPVEYYKEIKAGICYESNYDIIMDTLPSVPKKIWEELLPFKDNALNMTGRVYNMHIMNYEEMNFLYLQNVHFWNWILDTEKIDMAFFSVIPHCLWEYTIYTLCKVKKIPTLLVDENWIGGMCSIATKIENLGSSTLYYFNKNLPVKIDKNCINFYNNAIEPRNPKPLKEKKRILKEQEEFVKTNFYGSIFDDIKDYLIHIVYCNILKRGQSWVLEASRQRLDKHLLQRRNRRGMVGKSYFNKFSQKTINMNTNFIVFFLQYEPESSTLPKAGIFGCQLLTIKLLAEVASTRNIKLYVKEHWGQDYRTKNFYNTLRRMQNVYFVNSEVDNYELIDKSLLVASQTGTCIVEAFLRGRTSVMFAYNAISDAPTVHYVTNKEELNKAIQDAENKLENNVDEETRMRYYSSICNTSIRSYLDWPSEWKFRKEDCINDITNLITEFISQGMPSDFYYERTT